MSACPSCSTELPESAKFCHECPLEDHAFRACKAAQDIQKEVGTTLKLRIGLNSGQVIAGEIGSSAGSYTTIGEQVGMAQRMEPIAPPAG